MPAFTFEQGSPIESVEQFLAEVRVFSVIGRQRVQVEGAWVESWKVEERVQRDGRLVATWYLTDRSPYMVYAEVPLQNGQVQRMTGVSLDPD